MSTNHRSSAAALPHRAHPAPEDGRPSHRSVWASNRKVAAAAAGAHNLIRLAASLKGDAGDHELSYPWRSVTVGALAQVMVLPLLAFGVVEAGVAAVVVLMQFLAGAYLVVLETNRGAAQ